ncbi:MAG: hypothetical protein KY475_25550, partial [Planctomycetes bacterium]|nr:hypothetical protein [Planctomycetota bacterium]
MFALMLRGFRMLLGSDTPIRSHPPRRRIRLAGHELEPRRLLAVDAALLGFEAHGESFEVQYSVEDTSGPLRLALYASSDGVAPDRLLETIAIEDPAAGETQSAVIDAEFARLDESETLIARVESAVDALAYAQLAIQGGVFQDAEGVVHVFGTDRTDVIGVYEFGVLGVSFNGAFHSYEAGSVTGIVLHDVTSDDVVSMAGIESASDDDSAPAESTSFSLV